MMRVVDESLLSKKNYNYDDLVVVTAGSPPGIPGNTNMIQVHMLGQERRR